MRLIFLFLFVNIFSLHAQQDSTIHEFVDTDAEFPGGPSAMMSWMQKNVILPNVSGEDVEYSSKIHLEFVVEMDGSITNLFVHTACVSCKVAYEDLMKSSPKWIPAQHQGKTVRSRYRMPIQIHLE